MSTENQIVSHIKSIVNPVAILLFGSRATSSHGVYSDWDLIIISDNIPLPVLERSELESQIADPFIFDGIQLSPVLMTPGEFDQGLMNLDPLFPELHRKHSILYGEEWLAPRLERLASMLEAHEARYIPEFNAWEIKRA